MNYLNKYNSFKVNEANSNNESRERSGRLLTQAQVEYKDDVNKEIPQTLPTMIFTDVVGSSKMWDDDPVLMMKQLEEHHQLIETLSEKNKGWIVKTIGDAFMIYFEPSTESLTNALNCAKDIIVNEKKYNLRVGVCQGQMQDKTYRIQKVDLRDFYGNAVNVASRMESKIATEGHIAFSSTKQITENTLSRYKKLGELYEVNIKQYDLRGASINTAYTIKIK